METNLKQVIVDNLIELFNIMTSESGIKFVTSMEKVLGKNTKSIGDNIKDPNLTQLGYLTKVASKLKYKSQPKPYFDAIIEVLKSEDFKNKMKEDINNQ